MSQRKTDSRFGKFQLNEIWRQISFLRRSNTHRSCCVSLDYFDVPVRRSLKKMAENSEQNLGQHIVMVNVRCWITIRFLEFLKKRDRLSAMNFDLKVRSSGTGSPPNLSLCPWLIILDVYFTGILRQKAQIELGIDQELDMAYCDEAEGQGSMDRQQFTVIQFNQFQSINLPVQRSLLKTTTYLNEFYQQETLDFYGPIPDSDHFKSIPISRFSPFQTAFTILRYA